MVMGPTGAATVSQELADGAGRGEAKKTSKSLSRASAADGLDSLEKSQAPARDAAAAKTSHGPRKRRHLRRRPDPKKVFFLCLLLRSDVAGRPAENKYFGIFHSTAAGRLSHA